jgi:methylamine dehydrogenase heavy chain
VHDRTCHNPTRKQSYAWAALLLLAVVCAGDIASAAEPLPAEKLVTLPRIPSTGPLLYSTDGQRVLLTDAGTLKWQATLGFPGWRGQYVLPKTKDLAYLTTSVWEYGHGKRTSFVEIWNVPTASPTGVRIEVPPRLAITGPIQAMAGLSADEKFLFLQNATPAASVTVVDLVANRFAGEIPIPGCFGIYPSVTTVNKFISLCGDGRIVTAIADAKGKSAKIERSGPIFNADEDPLFVSSVHDGDTFFFVSYNGSVYEVDASGHTANLAQKYSIVDGTEGGCKPTGEQVLAYAPEAKVMFVLMIPDAQEGDQDSFGKEVWAVDVKERRVLSRSTMGSANGVAYAPLPTPALFSNDNDAKALVRYAVDPKAGYSVRMDKRLVVSVGSRLEAR